MASQNQFDSLMRELELERENAFENLLQVEEELESKVFPFASPPRQSSSAGDPEIKWLQQALNRVSAFRIAEDGVLSVQTRRALQKFQSEQGIKPSGKMGPR